MNATTLKAIEARAKQTAALFFEEFGEPLHSSLTDWDAVAWGEDRKELDLSPGDDEQAWLHYAEVLQQETKRLYDSAQATD